MNTPIINEDLARRSKENCSFSDYVQGSATEEYYNVIARAKEQINKAKTNASVEAQARLNALLERYTVRYANWVNNHNRNGSNHVSVMISGPSNYPMKKHEKFLAREDKLWAEYDELKNYIEYGISKILNGDKIIKSDDSNALAKLTDKLEKALAEHQGYKDHNIKARREKSPALPAYVLRNSNGRIKAIKDRIARLEKLAQQETKEIDVADTDIKIIDNVEANRLQIIFPDKPSDTVRTKLKSHGFRWSPTYGAWQRFRGNNSMYAAKQVLQSMQ